MTVRCSKTDSVDFTRYVIISPVRNEEQFVEKTIRSVLAQTIRPSEWIIVNDGSTDRTCEIIEKIIKEYSWITLLNLPDRGYYYPGTGVVEVFYIGFSKIIVKDWQYLVKLDCDIEFGSDYFAALFSKFREDPALGIASGVAYSASNNTLEKMHDDHPIGPSKVYSRSCFEAIGGLRPIPGWDLADILAAQMKGMTTRCFRELKILHYRRTGSRRQGVSGGKFQLGRYEYRFGYQFLYALVKGIYHMAEKPYMVGGAAMIFGFIYAWLRKESKLFDNDMVRFLRDKQRRFLLSKLGLKC